MLYMVTYTINTPQMLVHIYIYIHHTWILYIYDIGLKQRPYNLDTWNRYLQLLLVPVAWPLKRYSLILKSGRNLVIRMMMMNQ